MSLVALAGALIFAAVAVFVLGGLGALWVASWAMAEIERSSTDD